MTNPPNMIVTPDLPGTVHGTRLLYGDSGPRVLACRGLTLRLDTLDSTADTDRPITCSPCHSRLQEDRLYRSLRAFADEVKAEYGPFGSMNFGPFSYACGRVCATLKLGQDDGTDACYLLAVNSDPFTGEHVSSIEGTWSDSHDEYWSSLIDNYGLSSVRIDNVHYMIEAPAPRNVSGHGGKQFVILFTDGPREGTRVSTRNLWCQGTIPPKYRDALPNNAMFDGDFS